ncbi:ion channel [Microbacterium sp. M28]|uniref:ion channel n=1 Tax=Microbacterium sp. M28 TaxID=2962064 RepID=UPI0021F3FF6E|nr:ion channel [Microbacterium sp. M28]UYO96519.1 ion channel [Microbacterium sp. M28]
MEESTATRGATRRWIQTVSGPGSGWRTGYWLVLVLLVISYGLCAAEPTTDPSAIAFLVQLVTVAVTLRITGAARIVQRIAWLVLSVAGLAAVGTQLLDTRGHALDIGLAAASAIAFLIAPAAIIAHQVHRRGLDLEALLAALTAYALVGMFFTFVYNLIGLAGGGPIFGDASPDSLSAQLFFSFTTLTTTGFGNIVPAGPGVQTIAVAEAITGQLFLITAVARIMRGTRTPADIAAPDPRPTSPKESAP